MIKKISTILILSLLLFTACSTEDDRGENTETDSFDREAMLTHWADKFMARDYLGLKMVTLRMSLASKKFLEEPTQANLDAAREVYREAYGRFQGVSMFEIGKGEEINFRNYVNTYPADVAAIEANIASRDYNLELPSTYAQQGFPAADYLLYGMADTDEEIIKIYQEKAGVFTYLHTVMDRMVDLTAQMEESWRSFTRDDFVNNTSSSSTGSVDKFTNDYVMYFEKILRSGKIGYPAGAFTGTPSPQNVEAYYADDLSKELYQAALQSFYDFYLGKSEIGDGPSYSQYLIYLDSMKDGENLDDLIKAQFAKVFAESEKLDDSFRTQIATDNSVMLSNFDELQKLVVLLKLDMMQALSVSVDYVDSDGD